MPLPPLLAPLAWLLALVPPFHFAPFGFADPVTSPHTPQDPAAATWLSAHVLQPWALSLLPQSGPQDFTCPISVLEASSVSNKYWTFVIPLVNKTAFYLLQPFLPQIRRYSLFLVFQIWWTSHVYFVHAAHYFISYIQNDMYYVYVITPSTYHLFKK